MGHHSVRNIVQTKKEQKGRDIIQSGTMFRQKRNKNCETLFNQEHCLAKKEQK